jgi:hypothetical protein
MAKFRAWTGGDGTGGADNTNWAQAYQTVAAALAAASAGDLVLVHKTSQEEHGVDTSITIVAGVWVVCVDKDAGEALATMGTGGWIGNSTTSRNLEIGGTGGGFKGVTLRTAGGTSKNFFLNKSDGGHIEYEDCYFWAGNNSAAAAPRFSSQVDVQGYSRVINPTFRFGSTGHSIIAGGRLEVIGGSISSDGSAVTTLVQPSQTGDATGFTGTFRGFDASSASSTATLVGNSNIVPATVTFDRCPLPASYTMLATQSHLNSSSAEVFVLDCASGDIHGVFGYANPLGSIITDTAIRRTSGAAGMSWRIDTTANASTTTPFITPWIHQSGIALGSAITPRLEIALDGSTTPLTNAQVWSEWLAKTTSGSVIATHYSDRCALLAAAANQAAGAGTGAWSGLSGTAWSGKLDTGAAITLAEAGDVSGRIGVATPSITLYADPQPLTA